MTEPRSATDLGADACRRVAQPDSLHFASSADVEPMHTLERWADEREESGADGADG